MHLALDAVTTSSLISCEPAILRIYGTQFYERELYLLHRLIHGLYGMQAMLCLNSLHLEQKCVAEHESRYMYLQQC